MTEWFPIAAAVLGGVLIGLLFFGGLWWTVQRGVTAKRPALLFLGSLLVRMGVAVGGFYWIGDRDLKRFLACTAGFVVARVIIARFTAAPQREDSGHAS